MLRACQVHMWTGPRAQAAAGQPVLTPEGLKRETDVAGVSGGAGEISRHKTDEKGAWRGQDASLRDRLLLGLGDVCTCVVVCWGRLCFELVTTCGGGHRMIWEVNLRDGEAEARPADSINI